MLKKSWWALLCLAPMVAQAELVIGSWNIRHLGWQNDKSLQHVAHVANHLDVLAIQELMDESALEQLESRLETLSGEAWSSMASHALGRNSYREHYAFLWRDSSAAYEDGAVVFIDHADIFSREPYSARFRDLDTEQVIALATVHVVYGNSVGDRLNEIDALADYWSWLAEIYPETPRVLAGDFNLAPHHEGWSKLRGLGARPAVTEGRTTLSTTEGAYANLYDNLWYDAAELTPTTHGILHFTDLLPISHQEARDRVSDHLPVYLTLFGAEVEPVKMGGEVLASTTNHCVDLNKAPVARLEQLPHIGPARAEAIVIERPWGSSDELTRVRGISPARLVEIQHSGLLCK